MVCGGLEARRRRLEHSEAGMAEARSLAVSGGLQAGDLAEREGRRTTVVAWPRGTVGEAEREEEASLAVGSLRGRGEREEEASLARCVGKVGRR